MIFHLHWTRSACSIPRRQGRPSKTIFLTFISFIPAFCRPKGFCKRINSFKCNRKESVKEKCTQECISCGYLTNFSVYNETENRQWAKDFDQALSQLWELFSQASLRDVLCFSFSSSSLHSTRKRKSRSSRKQKLHTHKALSSSKCFVIQGETWTLKSVQKKPLENFR